MIEDVSGAVGLYLWAVFTFFKRVLDSGLYGDIFTFYIIMSFVTNLTRSDSLMIGRGQGWSHYHALIETVLRLLPFLPNQSAVDFILLAFHFGVIVLMKIYLGKMKC